MRYTIMCNNGLCFCKVKEIAYLHNAKVFRDWANKYASGHFIVDKETGEVID